MQEGWWVTVVYSGKIKALSPAPTEPQLSESSISPENLLYYLGVMEQSLDDLEGKRVFCTSVVIIPNHDVMNYPRSIQPQWPLMHDELQRRNLPNKYIQPCLSSCYLYYVYWAVNLIQPGVCKALMLKTTWGSLCLAALPWGISTTSQSLRSQALGNNWNMLPTSYFNPPQC